MMRTMYNLFVKTFARGAVAIAMVLGFVAVIEMSPIIMGFAAIGMLGGAVTEIYIVKH